MSVSISFTRYAARIVISIEKELTGKIVDINRTMSILDMYLEKVSFVTIRGILQYKFYLHLNWKCSSCLRGFIVFFITSNCIRIYWLFFFKSRLPYLKSLKLCDFKHYVKTLVILLYVKTLIIFFNTKWKKLIIFPNTMWKHWLFSLTQSEKINYIP